MTGVAQSSSAASPAPGRSAPSPEYFQLAPPAPARCSWCDRRQPRLGRFCSKACRQTAHRLRRAWLSYHRVALVPPSAPRLRLAYADPPYPGLARKYYKGQPTFAGEVDHPALIASLEASFPQGWALSTSMAALRQLLPLCPPEVRVCTWTKPIGTPEATRGIHCVTEAVIVKPGRRLRGGIPDALVAQPARFGGDLPGRKPIAFVAWMFRLLGLQPGDELVDLFPGTGIVGRAWRELSGPGAALVVPRGPGDAAGSVARRRPRATPRGPGDAGQVPLTLGDPG